MSSLCEKKMKKSYFFDFFNFASILKVSFYFNVGER